MRKPATPGPDPDARRDVVAGARTQDARDDTQAAWAEGKFRAASMEGSSDELNLNDAWLVERARHGDHQAFAVLVRRYERKLIRVLTRLVREPEQARDLAQETFWRVYTRLDRFDTARRFGPWLFRVGVNAGLDWLLIIMLVIRRPPRTTLSPNEWLSIFEAPGRAPWSQAPL